MLPSQFQLIVYQRWRPRGHILKSLASKPQVLENCPVLGTRIALVFLPLKFCWKAPEAPQKIFKELFLFSSSGDRLKKILETFSFDFLFLENTCRMCPWSWPREDMSLALASEFFCVHGLGLEPCVLESTSGFYRFLSAFTCREINSI